MGRTAIFFASGDAFFVGAALLVCAALAHLSAQKWAGIIKRVLILLGAMFVALSATPLSIWLYGVWGLAAACLFFASQPRVTPRRRAWLTAAPLMAASLLSAATEIPWHFTPHLASGGAERMFVIGDSITAGIGDGTLTWPELLRQEKGIEVCDTSAPGLSAASALAAVREVPAQAFVSAIVIIEIGGNDMLAYGTHPARFEKDLERLLAFVQRPGARVLMLELPLPPFHNRFGRIQRALAREYNVLVVPKRSFGAILANPHGTIDGLHLSQEGQRTLAAVMWNVAGPAFEADAGG